MRTTICLQLSALVLGSIIAGCSSDSGGGTLPGGVGGKGSTGGSTASSSLGGSGQTGGSGTATNTGGATSSNVGGTTATGGSGNTPTGGKTGTTTSTGGNSPTGGSGNTPTGGKSNTGGSGNTPTGGAQPTGGTGNPAGGNGTSTGGTTGTSTGAGGTTSTGGSTTVGGGGACTPGPEVLSDFEGGKAIAYQIYPKPTGANQGFWYTYKDSTTCASSAQVPAAVTDAAVSSTALPAGDSRASACNASALHSTISNCGTYSGFGISFGPVTGSNASKAVDLSGYDGVSFWVKAGTAASGTNVGANLNVELLTQECRDADFGGTGPKDPAVDYICRGKLLTGIGTTWQQVFLPFYNSGPRSFPAVKASTGASCATGTICEPSQMNPAHLQGIQFSLQEPYNQSPTVANSYDIWVDDVALFKFSDTPANQGLAVVTQDPSTVNKFPQNKTFAAGCTKPTGADGKLILNAYAKWKTNFVQGTGASTRVVSPEIGAGVSVSEGIAYGMLIAVYMGDKTLFDGLYGYWKANAGAGTLMTWKIPGGSGSATDADEDAAFALIEASKQWPSGGYSATAMLADIWSKDIDATTKLPKGGSNYGSVNPTNPSYFSPAMYKEFAKVDAGHDWAGVVTAVYNAFNTGIGNAVTSGLVPAWCGNNCTTVSTNGAATDGEYQYDSHRVPWRLALDACWNGATTGSAYLSKLVGFFNTQAATGLANLSDIYQTSGSPDTTNGAPNSMSLIGCAGVGAMTVSSASGFANRAWQFLLAGQYSDSPSFLGKLSTKGGYTYYNATVGLLTMMTMSGNIYPM